MGRELVGVGVELGFLLIIWGLAPDVSEVRRGIENFRLALTGRRLPIAPPRPPPPARHRPWLVHAGIAVIVLSLAAYVAMLAA